jgi:hypothetical protein
MVNRQKKALGWVGTVKTGYHALMGKDLSKAVNKRAVGAVEASPSSYKKGGKVKRTGKALVHKNEVILPASTVKTLKRLLH